MKCYYEVLDVSQTADDAEIKSSYRKLALKWHPDKNMDNVEHAKEQFQVVQQAYEVLSDRQERAWYDNHREQILRGSNSDFQDNSLDVFPYFTTACFKGYDDSEEGFYTVYREVFEKIAKEDMDFMEDKEEFCEIPGFGNSQSDYDQVVANFYAYWMSYSTKKSYVWLDPYDIKETRGRVLKMIEKENKKIRLKAKKERNEEIRNLVAFVRKRDKRVQVYKKIQEAQILENRKKHEVISKQKRLERRKLNESSKEAEWSKFDNVKSQLEEIEKHLAQEFGETLSNSEEESDKEDLNNLYCAACNKVFKTPKAFANHESSKKHKENIEQILEEDKYFQDLEDSDFSEKALSDLSLEAEIDQDFNSDSESLEEIQVKPKKKNKKSKNVIQTNGHHDELESVVPLENMEDEEFDFNTSKKQKRKNKKGNVKVKFDAEGTELLENGNTQEIPSSQPSTSKKNKKEKRTKKEVSDCDVKEIDVSHCCVTCKSTFPSKNKLFDHLKKTGHGVYIHKSSSKNKKSIS